MQSCHHYYSDSEDNGHLSPSHDTEVMPFYHWSNPLGDKAIFSFASTVSLTDANFHRST